MELNNLPEWEKTNKEATVTVLSRLSGVFRTNANFRVLFSPVH